LKDFVVNIIGLSKKTHSFQFELKDGFFEIYGKEVISSGDFDARVSLDKRETFIEADFKISGNSKLICDRSLEPFDYKLNIDRKIIFKYGEEPQEISDEIVIITRDQDSINIGQYIYEFIALSIPIKKIHPDLMDEEENDDETNVKIVYSTSSQVEENGNQEEEIDPRWEKLKKLKK
jgi:uncharacterized metal-binding protein YceD (DUF177 family)